MSQTQKKKRNFAEWIYKYRKIVFLTLFFILLPIVIIISLYSGTKNNGSKVYFDAGSNDFVKTNKFIDVEDFDAVLLTVDYTRVEKLLDTSLEDGEEEKIIGKKYYFTTKYEKNILDVTQVTITPVMVAPWSSYYKLVNGFTLTEGSNRSFSVEFGKLTPYRALPFVHITNPMLYLRVQYTVAGHETIKYVSFDLATDNEVINQFD